jgi:hypothetical protein
MRTLAHRAHLPWLDATPITLAAEPRSTLLTNFTLLRGFLGMASRIQALTGHLTAAKAAGGPGVKSPDDVVVVWAKRTAIGRARKGVFRDTTPDTLLAKVLEAAVQESGVPHEALGDICVGNVQLGGAYAGPGTFALFVVLTCA